MSQNSKLTPNIIAKLCTAGGTAPSGGNAQPWLVNTKKNSMIVKLNPQKLNTFIHANNYDAIYALGSFVANIKIAASKYKFGTTTHINHPKDPNLFSITITFTHNTSIKTHPLYSSIAKRETNRQIAKKKTISTSTINTFTHTLSKLSTNFRLNYAYTNNDKKALGKILGKADVLRTKVIKHHNRMMAEIRWNDQQAKQSRDGIDIKTMELPGNVVKMLKLLKNHPSLVKTIPDIALEKSTHPIIENCSHLCCLSSIKPISPLSIYHAGYTSQHLWLHSTKHKLALQPWTVLTFFTLSARLLPQKEFTKKQEQMLFNLEAQFKKTLHIPSKHTPILIFRLSHADPPTTRALRYHWQDFTNFI